MKKAFLFLFFIFSLIQQGLYAETITMTTYYPAPFGAYDRLRLVPRGDLTGSCDPGTIYMRSSNGDLQFCQSDQTWGPLPGFWKQVGDNLYPVNYANPDLKVGIGTTAPVTTLDVPGGVKVGGWTICDAARAGTLRWASTTSQMEYCDGSFWFRLSAEQSSCTIGDTRTVSYQSCSCGAGSLIWEGTVDQECQDNSYGEGEWVNIDYHCCPTPPPLDPLTCVCDP